MTDLSNDPEFKAFAAHVNAHLIPMVMGADASISLVPRTEVDIKYAIELGLSIMLDKPLVIVAQTRQKIPEHLRRVADAVVVIDQDDPTKDAENRAKIAEAVAMVFADLGDEEEN
jgi:hypothetical protein